MDILNLAVLSSDGLKLVTIYVMRNHFYGQILANLINRVISSFVERFGLVPFRS